MAETITLTGEIELDSLLRALARGPAPPSWVLPELAPGQLLGHYRIIERLGRGAMGVVYRALDIKLARDVALKLVAKVRPGAEDELREVAREARVLAVLDHPNLVTVFSLEAIDTVVFITMDFVAGEDLRERLVRAGPLPRAEVLRAALELARGLAAAHGAGIVHRDVKPENVRLSPAGEFVLLDFGLARFIEDGEDEDGEGERGGPSGIEASDSTATAAAGTPAYMAPEVHAGALLDARVDVWAFGLVVLELATGSRDHEPGDLARLPRRLRAIIQRCLAPDPDQRFADARELLERLEPRRRSGPIIVGLMLAVAIGAGLATELGSDPCATPDALLAGVWDAPTRARIDVAFARSGLGYAADARTEVEAAFGRYIGQWSAQRRALCEVAEAEGRRFAGSGEQRCLDRLLDRAAKLSASFQRGESDTITIAAELIAELRPAQVCAELPPFDGAGPSRDQTQLFAFEDRIMRAQQLGRAGDEAEAIAVIDRAVDGAKALGDEAGLTRALLAKAQIAASFPDPAQALDAAHWVVELASRIGDDEALGQALILLVEIRTAHTRYDEAEVVGELARRIVMEVGGPDQRIRVREELGALAIARERWPEARALLEPARVAAIELYGPDHLVVAGIEQELAWVLGTSQHDEALADRYHRHALEVHVERYGTHHPAVATSYNDLGVYHYQRVEYEQAEDAYMRALAIYTESLGAEHPETLTTLANLANLAMMRGDIERSIELGRAVLDGRARTLGTDSDGYAHSARDHAVALQHAGRAQAALPLLLHYYAWTVETRGEQAPVTLDAVARIIKLGLLFEDDPLIERYGASLRAGMDQVDEDHPRFRALLALMTALSVYERDYVAALAYAERRMAWQRARPEAQSTADAFAFAPVGEALVGLGRASQARARLLEAIEIVEASDRDPLDLHFLIRALAGAEAALGDLAAARQRLLALESIYAKTGKRPHMRAKLLCDLAEYSEQPARRRYAQMAIDLLADADILPHTRARARALLDPAPLQSNHRNTRPRAVANSRLQPGSRRPDE